MSGLFKPSEVAGTPVDPASPGGILIDPETELSGSPALDEVIKGDGLGGWLIGDPPLVRSYDRGFSFFGTAGNPYVSTSSLTYVDAAQFCYPGSAALTFPPDGFKAIVSASVAGSTSSFRLFDLTNSLTIAEVVTLATGTTPVIFTFASVNNLPVGEAIFEMQLRKDTGGAARLAFINLFAA